jgi:hypothetical protein
MARACCDPVHAAYWLAWQPAHAALPTNVGSVSTGWVIADRGTSHHAAPAATTPMVTTHATIHARIGWRVRGAAAAVGVVPGATPPGRFGVLRFLRVTD